MQKAKKWQNKNYVFRMVYAGDNIEGTKIFDRIIVFKLNF